MVGKSDFNENPVVSLDLDLDFGLRLRVCQNLTCNTKEKFGGVILKSLSFDTGGGDFAPFF